MKTLMYLSRAIALKWKLRGIKLRAYFNSGFSINSIHHNNASYILLEVGHMLQIFNVFMLVLIAVDIYINIRLYPSSNVTSIE